MTKENAPALSEYELTRLENIRKNEEFLKSIGLYKDPSVPEVRDELPKGKKSRPKRTNKFEAKDDPDYVDEDVALPVRRSTRNSGVSVKHEELSSPLADLPPKQKRRYNPARDAQEFFESIESGNGAEELAEDDDGKRVVLKPDDIRAYIESINPAHSASISNAAVQLCAYRSGYMSLAALKNRIKAISSGASARSYEKLLVVSYTMKAMGLHGLAEMAAVLLRQRTQIVLPWCPQQGDNGSGGVKEEDCGGSAGEGKSVKSEAAASTVVPAVVVKLEPAVTTAESAGDAYWSEAGMVDRNECKSDEESAAAAVSHSGALGGVNSDEGSPLSGRRRRSVRVKTEAAPS